MTTRNEAQPSAQIKASRVSTCKLPKLYNSKTTSNYAWEVDFRFDLDSANAEIQTKAREFLKEATTPHKKVSRSNNNPQQKQQVSMLGGCFAY